MTGTSINARLAQVIDKLKLNNNSFANAIGIHGSTIGNITGGRLGKPSFEILEKIAIAFPIINMDWMVRGEGALFKNESIGNADADCWELVRQAQQRAQQLQTDYDTLLEKFQALKRGE